MARSIKVWLLAGAFAAFVIMLNSCQEGRTAEPITILLTSGDDISPWQILDCNGVVVALEPGKPLPVCLMFTAPTGARVKIDQRLGATIAGVAGGTRTVYVATATRTRGKALGALTVGTVAKPLGFLCDATDTIKSGTTVYSKIIDPAVPEALRGYTSGCIS